MGATISHRGYERRSSSALGTFIIAVVIIAALAVQLNLHARERHGESAGDLPAMFNNSGQCSRGSSIEAQAQNGFWVYVCFMENGKIALWVLLNRIGSSINREITAIPEVRDVGYIARKFLKDSYVVYNVYGELPDLFTSALTRLFMEAGRPIPIP